MSSSSYLGLSLSQAGNARVSCCSYVCTQLKVSNQREGGENGPSHLYPPANSPHHTPNPFFSHSLTFQGNLSQSNSIPRKTMPSTSPPTLLTPRFHSSAPTFQPSTSALSSSLTRPKLPSTPSISPLQGPPSATPTSRSRTAHSTSQPQVPSLTKSTCAWRAAKRATRPCSCV